MNRENGSCMLCNVSVWAFSPKCSTFAKYLERCATRAISHSVHSLLMSIYSIMTSWQSYFNHISHFRNSWACSCLISPGYFGRDSVWHEGPYFMTSTAAVLMLKIQTVTFQRMKFVRECPLTVFVFCSAFSSVSLLKEFKVWGMKFDLVPLDSWQKFPQFEWFKKKKTYLNWRPE